jgi:hypothetical protein
MNNLNYIKTPFHQSYWQTPEKLDTHSAGETEIRHSHIADGNASNRENLAN